MLQMRLHIDRYDFIVIFYLGQLKINYMFIFQENLCPQHFVCCLYINSANRLLLGFHLTVVFLLRTLNPQWLFHMNIQHIRVTFKFCHKQSKKKVHTTACNAVYQFLQVILIIFPFSSPSDERMSLSKIWQDFLQIWIQVIYIFIFCLSDNWVHIQSFLRVILTMWSVHIWD